MTPDRDGTDAGNPARVRLCVSFPSPMSEHPDDALPTTVDELAWEGSVDLAEAIVENLISRERSWPRVAMLADQLAWVTSWAARQERRS
jgi:hypothetical protein